MVFLSQHQFHFSQTMKYFYPMPNLQKLLFYFGKLEIFSTTSFSKHFSLHTQKVPGNCVRVFYLYPLQPAQFANEFYESQMLRKYPYRRTRVSSIRGNRYYSYLWCCSLCNSRYEILSIYATSLQAQPMKLMDCWMLQLLPLPAYRSEYFIRLFSVYWKIFHVVYPDHVSPDARSFFFYFNVKYGLLQK